MYPAGKITEAVEITNPQGPTPPDDWSFLKVAKLAAALFASLSVTAITVGSSEALRVEGNKETLTAFMAVLSALFSYAIGDTLSHKNAAVTTSAITSSVIVLTASMLRAIED